MNKLKTTILGVGCMAVLSLTSCLSSDDDNSNTGLTPQERALCATATRGAYSGNLLYFADATKQVPDTVKNMTWRVINDSTMTISNFPSERLADYVSDTELKEALAAAGPRDITAYIYFVQTTPTIGFYVYPSPLEYQLNYGGATHKVTVYLHNPYYPASGVYSTTDNTFGSYLYEYAVVVDDATSVTNLDFPSGTSRIPFIIAGKK